MRGRKIIEGLNDVLEWTQGETKRRVTLFDADGDFRTCYLTIDEQKSISEALRRGDKLIDILPLPAPAEPMENEPE